MKASAKHIYQHFVYVHLTNIFFKRLLTNKFCSRDSQKKHVCSCFQSLVIPSSRAVPKVIIKIKNADILFKNIVYHLECNFCWNKSCKWLNTRLSNAEIIQIFPIKWNEIGLLCSWNTKSGQLRQLYSIGNRKYLI